MSNPDVSGLVRISQIALEANLEAPDYLIHESDIQSMVEAITPRLKAEGLREGLTRALEISRKHEQALDVEVAIFNEIARADRLSSVLRENEAMRHDIDRMASTTTELATENERLREIIENIDPDLVPGIEQKWLAWYKEHSEEIAKSQADFLSRAALDSIKPDEKGLPAASTTPRNLISGTFKPASDGSCGNTRSTGALQQHRR